jgi:hypothetical protein
MAEGFYFPRLPQCQQLLSGVMHLLITPLVVTYDGSILLALKAMMVLKRCVNKSEPGADRGFDLRRNDAHGR